MAPTFPVEFSGQRVTKKLSQNNSTQMMGKTRKVSKGYSHGFVPDYRHAVDTTANSEGFGSSGRIDTEITASEDSCVPNRKSLTLNPDSYQQFGVPVQVLSLSKLSSFERKELGKRLKQELEQVRNLQKNIGMVNSNIGTTLSPSDVHSCSAGQRKPIPEYSRSMSLPMPKRKAPPGRNGSRSKKTTRSTRVESLKKSLPLPLPPTTSGTGNAMLMKQCETLLNRLMSHNFGWVFNTPVDVIELKIPDYYTVIQHPMDLGTVKTKLMSGKYSDPWGFAGDVRLTFSNAMTYNPRGNDVHIMAETLSKFFEVRWKPIEKKLVIPMRQNVLETETEIEIEPIPPYKKKKSLSNETKQEPVKRKMSDVEKHKLSSELESSLADLPERIIDFLKENSSNRNSTMDDEIEIDIDTLSDDTLFKLRKLLDDHFLEKQKHIVKDEIEINNESGFSNSSMQPCKGNEGNEEDVDIGGDELPISSFPPVEIEKDTVVRNSKCSSSSSSSSSGSSCSDSDSGSSSGSESDDAKASTILNNVKDTMDTNQIPVSHDAKDCENVEDQRCNSSEVERRQEGETSERQVSPDKLYRAALLRSRFADTILKAQEKTTGKVEKEDIERLRLEKEEVEKRRKQEKARLEAEAKAAAEARRIAELEAVAEAKRKRELEREAARQALQKMEKMVDINDNSGFLEDLEMLSVAPVQPLESFIDETSVDCGVENFNFNGKGNPLEQLGLYMKDDDEEDDEVEPRGGPPTGDDPEEGEID